MKKIRGIMLLAAVLTVLAYATVAQAGGGTVAPMGCQTDPVSNIVWCRD